MEQRPSDRLASGFQTEHEPETAPIRRTILERQVPLALDHLSGCEAEAMF